MRCQQRRPFGEGAELFGWGYGGPSLVDPVCAVNSVVRLGRVIWTGLWQPFPCGPSVRCQQRRPFGEGYLDGVMVALPLWTQCALSTASSVWGGL